MIPNTLNSIQHIESAWKGHENFAVSLVKWMKPTTIVELGVDFGFSTIAFALPNIGTVYGVDHFAGDEHAGYRNTYEQVVKQIGHMGIDNVVLIQSDFSELSKKWDKEIDILHIDGLHTYEMVKRDFNNWAGFVKDDGVILLHDTISFPDDVGRLFAEIRMPKFNFTHSHGLGIIAKNQEVLNKIVSLITDNGYSDMSLKALFYTNQGRISDKWSNYLDVFDRFFLPYKNRPVNLLEMGVQHGGTLNVYSRYFHPGSNIVGVDIDPRCKQLEEGNIKIFTGNFSDAGFMRSFPYEFDIIIDDGSHMQDELLNSFNTMFPLLKAGGTYVVENLRTAYWQDYKGGLKKEGTFIEHVKGLVDDVNGFHIREAHNPAAYNRWIKGIYITDSIAVVEKSDVINTPAVRVTTGSRPISRPKVDKKFLIVLNYYERPQLVRNTLNSIRELQSDNWELAFIDDGSIAEGEPIAREIFTERELWRTKFYRCNDSIEQKRVQGGSRHGQYNNEAICNSDADYFIMLCDDDAIIPDYFARLNEVLGFKPYPYAYCNILFFNPSKESYKNATIMPRERFQGSNYRLNHHHPLNPSCCIDASQMICNTGCVKEGLVKFPYPQTACLDANVYQQLYALYGNCTPVNIYGQYKATHVQQLGNRKEHYIMQ